MGKLLGFLASSKLALGIAWFILLFPALIETLFVEPLYLPMLYFLCFALYLSRARSHLVVPLIIYILLMQFPPYFFFIRWLDHLMAGQISFHEYFDQEYSLLRYRLTHLTFLGVLISVLTIPSVYIINLKRKLKQA